MSRPIGRRDADDHHLALPADAVAAPGVLVLHEAWGLNDDIRRICDRFAEAGYVALAPDLLTEGSVRCLVQAFRDLIAEEGSMVRRAERWLRHLGDLPEVDEDRLAVAGFCMGGGFALLLGAGNLARAVSDAYGRVPSDETVRRLCPVVASYGEKDRFFVGQARRLERILEAAGIPHDVKIYPGAGHSFMNDGAPAWYRPLGRVTAVEYHPEAAEDAWRRILEFFATHV